MLFSSVFTMAALIVASAQASYLSYESPKKGDVYYTGQGNHIQWDKSSIKGKGKVDVYLSKGGSVDITEFIIKIAVGIDNGGSYQWTPPDSFDVSITAFVIIIVDSSKNIYNSDNFSIHKGHGHNNGYKNGGHGGHIYHNTTVQATNTTTSTSVYWYTTNGLIYTTSTLVIQTIECSTSTSEATAVYTSPLATYQSAPIYSIPNATVAVAPAATASSGGTGSGSVAAASGTSPANTASPPSPAFTGGASTLNTKSGLFAMVGLAGMFAYLL